MDALLPSEIARLVLGYLLEQKCEEVAKMFLETSPDLQECKLVAQRGGRYSTKVGGLCLTDMLDKYCALNAMIQEKLNKVSDNEQIKSCIDVAEQLRFLLEGSRGHRFVVNINVPTQNSPNGSFGTPVISTSSRKRQQSSSDRGKRVVKSLNNLLDKDSQTSAGQSCDTVEATPLESLPGHKPSAKQLRFENQTSNVVKSPSKTDSMQNVPKETVVTSIGTQSDLNVLQNTLRNQASETVSLSNSTQTPNKSTEETSTEQPIDYCSTEVQTAPQDLFDVNHDINYEPIANLSILTEELLHRTELAEQIAENINKSIIPIQENVHENPEANLSLLQGFDNAVKSAVETTDKVLEGLFNEMFAVTDNPDEDSNEIYIQGINNGAYNENFEPMDIDNNTESMSSQNVQQTKRPEVPLKQRLRSSSRSHINPEEDERDCNALLENQNEEAIRSIVANVMASKQSSVAENPEQAMVDSANDIQQSELQLPDDIPAAGNENIEPNKNANNAKLTKAKKNPRKPRTPKQKTDKIEAKAAEIKQQEKDIVTLPTLIVCSENDIKSNPPFQPPNLGYVRIAPKPNQITPESPSDESSATTTAPKIYLRTVNVPRHLVKPSQLEASDTANQLMMQLQASPQKSTSTSPTSCSGSPIVVPIVIADDKQQQQQQKPQKQEGGAAVQQGSESITLYGDDSNSEVKVPAPVVSLPVISLDESACNLAAGTGLSPFFKGNADAEVTTATTQLSDSDQPKTIFQTKKLVEAHQRMQASDEKDEPEIQKQINEKNRKEGNAREMTNLTIIDTTPDQNETKIESNVPENVVEKIDLPTKKSVDANKEKSVVKENENKEDDETISSRSESQVNKAPMIVEKKKNEQKEDSKVDKKSVAAKRSTKVDEKPIPAKKDIKIEEKSASLAKKDVAPEAKPALVKDTKLEEKAQDVSARKVEALITKRTPKSLLKDRSKNNRLSLSTPRRRNSHVRALDFDEKTPEHATNTRKVVQSCTRPKSSAVQGLFQSPPFSGETPPVTISEQPTVPEEPKAPVRTHVSVPPIATRSPAPKLQGNWNKVAGIGMILGDSESSPEKSQSSANLSTIVEEKEPPKSWDSDLRKIVGAVNEEDDKRPKSAKKSRRRNSIKGKTTDAAEVTQRSTSAKKNTLSKTSTPDVSQEHLKITPPSASLKPKISVPTKTSPELLARFRDLQTPCKIETFNVPPTPRIMFATPGSCLVKIGSGGKEISIKDCVNTPDFPPTPSILLTPKIIEEEEHEKKPSPYYEPSDESAKEIASGEKIVVQQVTTTVTIQKKNVVELKESKTVEITKYGVIEENMPAQKQVKEAETTSEDNSKEIAIEEENMEEANASADTTNTDSDSDSDSDSNSSTSSSSSNSSSSDSSSCSSNASSPTKSVVNVSQHDNSTTESEVDSPKKVLNDCREELAPTAESSFEKENPSAKVVVDTAPQVQQLTSTISAIITNEEPAMTKSSAKPKIISDKMLSPPPGMSELNLQLEEKRQRVMAKFKQTVNSKRPVTVKRVTAVKKVQVTQTATKKVVKQEPPAKKTKPSPKKKVPEVKNEEVKPKNTSEDAKENLKTKVDQVKRDLFAPVDEAEQRTTRSQTARKSVDENPLPGVLECLELIPANKSADDDLLDQTAEGLSNNHSNSLEVSFVYDDSVPIKKRKRNYSNSELENEYTYAFPEEDVVRTLKVEPYIEFLTLASKTAKKKSPKKSPIKAKRKVARLPLAASSPIKKDRLQKRKLSKRKASPIKEEKQVEKKAKVEQKGVLDPQALFKKIDVDKFLKTVHTSK